jgi:small subunit ribosomal protein S4
MALNTKAKGKIVRRLGVNIFGNPKYDKLLSRKPHGPGQAKGIKRPRKESEYGLQLKEKQKLRFAYGLNERQFLNTFKKAKKQAGKTGTNFMVMLEQRLDNVVYRLGFSATRSQARQLVSHGHVRVNGRRVTIPSYMISEGDTVEIHSGKSMGQLVREKIAASGTPVPVWLNLNQDELKGNVVRLPYRDDIPTVANDQMVIEYYSR